MCNYRENLTTKLAYNYLFISQVIIIDPTSPFSGPPLKLGETLLKHATPVRVGLVLATRSDDPTLEAAIRSAFNFVAQEKNSNKEAFYFLSQVRKFVLFFMDISCWCVVRRPQIKQ